MHLYLKKVVLILRDENQGEAFLLLTEKLQYAGIAVDKIYEMKCGPFECHKTKSKKDSRDNLENDGTLYITDRAEQATFLDKKGLPVLGWLHDGGDSLFGLSYVMKCPEEIDVPYLEKIYRRFRDIPWDILETERCLLRETTVADVDAFFEIYSNPEIVRYTEELYSEKEQEQAYIREYIDKVYRYFEFGVWTVLLKETGEIIGRAGFSVREGYSLPELGFVIGVPWQGMGIATEICSAILQYGEEEFDFDRIQVLVHPGNKASFALCKRLGFTQERNVMESQQEYSLLIRYS